MGREVRVLGEEVRKYDYTFCSRIGYICKGGKGNFRGGLEGIVRSNTPGDCFQGGGKEIVLRGVRNEKENITEERDR